MGKFAWPGKVVFITGASSGIGQALAELLAAHGARLGLLGRDRARLESVAVAARTAGCPAIATGVADVCDSAAFQTATQALKAELGPCDILIASAGVHRFSNARKFDPSAAGEVISTNVIGVINAFGAVLPDMLDRNSGHLVAISSIAGIIALPTAGAYSASKAAVLTLCDSLRLDLHPTRIRVTSILPGFVDTPLLGDHDRSNIGVLLTPQETARRIARAIERGKRRCAFPFRTWLLASLASRLPYGISAAMWSRLMRQKRSRRRETVTG